MNKAFLRRRWTEGDLIKSIDLDEDKLNLIFPYVDDKDTYKRDDACWCCCINRGYNRTNNCCGYVVVILVILVLAFFVYFSVLERRGFKSDLPADLNGNFCGFGNMDSKKYLFVGPTRHGNGSANAWCVNRCPHAECLQNEAGIIQENDPPYCSVNVTCACTNEEPWEVASIDSECSSETERAGGLCNILEPGYHLMDYLYDEKICQVSGSEVEYSFEAEELLLEFNSDILSYPVYGAIAMVVALVSVGFLNICPKPIMCCYMGLTLLTVLGLDAVIVLAIVGLCKSSSDDIGLLVTSLIFLFIYISGRLTFRVVGVCSKRDKIVPSIILMDAIKKFRSANCCITIIPVFFAIIEYLLMYLSMNIDVSYSRTQSYKVDPEDLHKIKQYKPLDYVVYGFAVVCGLVVPHMMSQLSVIMIAAVTTMQYFSRTKKHSRFEKTWPCCRGLHYVMFHLVGTSFWAGIGSFISSWGGMLVFDILTDDGNPETVPKADSCCFALRKKLVWLRRHTIACLVNLLFDVLDFLSSPGVYVVLLTQNVSYFQALKKTRHLRYRHVSSGMVLPDVIEMATSSIADFTMLLVALIVYIKDMFNKRLSVTVSAGKIEVLAGPLLDEYEGKQIINIQYVWAFFASMYILYNVVEGITSFLQREVECLYACYLIDMELQKADPAYVPYACQAWREIMETVRKIGVEDDDAPEGGSEEQITMPGRSGRAMSYFTELYDGLPFDSSLLPSGSSSSGALMDNPDF